MTSTLDVPEKAIQAFEKWSGLTVCVHDITETLWPFLLPERFHHHQPLCQAVKQSAHGQKCHDFEILRLRAEIGDYQEGRVHVCHAGLVEWVVPVFFGKRLDWILFAGQRIPGRTFDVLRDPARKTSPPPWSKGVKMPAPVDNADSEMFLEGLRQLAARLKLWFLGNGLPHDGKPSTDPPKKIANRRLQILRFVHLYYAERVSLRDLAEMLHLSESRAAHLVQETFGRRFGELITEARLRAAASLLRHSNLPVSEVGLRSGFEDPSRFHRIFKSTMKSTPREYRSQVIVS